MSESVKTVIIQSDFFQYFFIFVQAGSGFNEGIGSGNNIAVRAFSQCFQMRYNESGERNHAYGMGGFWFVN